MFGDETGQEEQLLKEKGLCLLGCNTGLQLLGSNGFKVVTDNLGRGWVTTLETAVPIGILTKVMEYGAQFPNV